MPTRDGSIRGSLPGKPIPVRPDRAVRTIDARWRRLTEDGHAAVARKDALAAGRAFTRALAEADRLLAAAADRGGMHIIMGPMLHTIACHNSAEVAWRAGRSEVAAELCRRAVHRLLGVADGASVPLTLRINCVRHLRYALAFLDREPAVHVLRDGEQAALTARAHAIAVRVLATADHVQARPDAGAPPRSGTLH